MAKMRYFRATGIDFPKVTFTLDGIWLTMPLRYFYGRRRTRLLAGPDENVHFSPTFFTMLIWQYFLYEAWDIIRTTLTGSSQGFLEVKQWKISQN
jgi:hypothetical protein